MYHIRDAFKVPKCGILVVLYLSCPDGMGGGAISTFSLRGDTVTHTRELLVIALSPSYDPRGLLGRFFFFYLLRIVDSAQKANDAIKTLLKIVASTLLHNGRQRLANILFL